MPSLLGKASRFLHHSGIDKWWGNTTESVLREMISDPRLRAVLATQRGDYGPDPSESSFGLHAVVMHHYMQGAYFPVGGADAFAAGLVPVIEQGGGEVRTRAAVVDILMDKDTVVGVRLKDGKEERCPLVFSDVGARNTVTQLLPAHVRAGVQVVLVRRDAETSDIAAIECATGLLTQRGARTSHAAVVARQLGKVCLVGCAELQIDDAAGTIKIGDTTLHEGDLLTLDGNDGSLYAGAAQTEMEYPVELLTRLESLRQRC
jgi:phosphohistidine swiveling domain-containing protein